MLRPTDTVQKLLLSSPAPFIAEYEAAGVVITHAWRVNHLSHGEQSPLYRTFFTLSFITAEVEKAAGMIVPDYSSTGTFMCAIMAVLFGKRFDHHGAIEMTGSFHVPDLDHARELCNPERPYHGRKLRADYPVPLDLRELTRFRSLTETQPTDAKLSATFRTGALFYARALRAVGLDPEVAYLHLITACERIAEAAPLAEIELESEVKSALARIENELVDGERVARLFRKRMRQLKRRFSGLITSHLDEAFFTRHESNGGLKALQANTFPRAAAAAYDLRSRYVHAGTEFGRWIAPSHDNAERQIGRPVVYDPEMAKILAQAPTFIGLERITRVLLLVCAKLLGADLSPAGENEDSNKSASLST